MAATSADLRNVEVRVHARSDGSVLTTFRVRWIDEEGNRQRETFDTLEEAIAFRDELEARAERLRQGPPQRAHFTVGDGYERWWNEHVEPTLAERTRNNYTGAWKRHLKARVAHLLLIDLTTPEIERVKDELLAAGVGASSVRMAIAVLGSLLGYAVRRGYVDHNTSTAVAKPASRAKRKRRMPPSVEAVERMRWLAIEAFASPLTAIWISLGAYAGLRPGEIRALVWREVGEATISVADALDPDGSPRGDTKTYKERSPELWHALAEDLWAWRVITPFSADDDLVIPRFDGSGMTDDDYKNFVDRKFTRAATEAGWTCTPYDLRHFNASLLIKEGRLSLQEIANHLGHTVGELSRTYAREIAEYRGRQIDVQQEIVRVRGELDGDEPLRAMAIGLGAELALCPKPQASTTSAAASSPADDVLRKLVDLNVAGVLSDEELITKLKVVARG